MLGALDNLAHEDGKHSLRKLLGTFYSVSKAKNTPIKPNILTTVPDPSTFSFLPDRSFSSFIGFAIDIHRSNIQAQQSLSVSRKHRYTLITTDCISCQVSLTIALSITLSPFSADIKMRFFFLSAVVSALAAVAAAVPLEGNPTPEESKHMKESIISMTRAMDTKSCDVAKEQVMCLNNLIHDRAVRGHIESTKVSSLDSTLLVPTASLTSIVRSARTK